MHQTGSLSSHEIIVIPTRALSKEDKEYAIAFAIPSDTKGLIHVIGRSTLDMRELDGCDIGNTLYSKYCPTLIFDDVFVPWERVFMCGETEFAADLVGPFLGFSPAEPRRMQVRKDRLHDRRGPHHDGLQRHAKAGHHKQKVIDMIHRSETLYGCCLAASYEGRKQPSGTYYIDTVLANASKLHEGKELAEAIRLMIDISGGFVADLPSDKDFRNPEVGRSS